MAWYFEFLDADGVSMRGAPAEFFATPSQEQRTLRPGPDMTAPVFYYPVLCEELLRLADRTMPVPTVMVQELPADHWLRLILHPRIAQLRLYRD